MFIKFSTYISIYNLKCFPKKRTLNKLIKFFKIIAIPFIAINTLASTPIIDGALNDAEWADAISYELEFEVSPGRNAPALLKTIASIKNDEDYLYVAFKAYADKKKIRATESFNNIKNNNTKNIFKNM